MNYRFQLAALQIDFICKMPTPNDVRHSLKALPDTLKDAYGEIYKRILDQKGSAPRLALGAFRWIRCSYEPLCSETLLDAITVEIGDDGGFSCEENITIDILLKICQNLLIFDKQLNVFRFAHLSVDEYLEEKLDNVESHSEIAKVCLSLLCTPSSWDSYDKTLRTEEGCSGNRHLLLYSTVFWPWHISRCESLNGSQILTCLCNRLMCEDNHQRWLGYHCTRVVAPMYTGDNVWRRAFVLQQKWNSPLSSVCILGLSRMFKNIFKSKPLVEKACIGRLLFPASQFGDLEIASLLIDWGADTTVANENGETPLHVALEYRNEVVARLLIERGADASVADEDGETPLHVASRHGNEAVARLLIDRGADALVADEDGDTLLHFALRHGNEAVARLLIDRGADASVADKYGQTPLHVA